MEYAARSLVRHGFTNIALLGDSGGNPAGQQNVAEALNREWAGTRARVHHLTDFYPGPGDAWLREQGETQEDVGSHASIHDTASLLFLKPDMLRLDKFGLGVAGDGSGLVGNPSRATAAFGERILEMQIAAAVRQIRTLRERRRR